jgi:hypothetical protein
MTPTPRTPTPQGISAKTLVQLRYFDPDGEELDTVIIYRSGNCSSIPARTAWVEVTYPASLLAAEEASQ